MPASDLHTVLSGPPRAGDKHRLETQLADFKDALAALEASGEAKGLHKPLERLLRKEREGAVLRGVLGSSPYLTRLMRRYPAEAIRFLSEDPTKTFEALLHGLRQEGPLWPDRASAKAALRRAKGMAHLLIALADLRGVWPLERVTGALTRFADLAVTLSLRHLFTEAAAQGKYTPADPAFPERESGYAVIGMGKYGAGELNYSSDIDIIVFFDEEILQTPNDEGPKPLAIALTRGLVSLMQDVTADGYVFRVDLRLRPDAGSTAVAVSTAAAELYYESAGQNWERAAMIKARACAGDVHTGTALLEQLGSFIWRRTLDYTALEDIQAIKRQIHAHKGLVGLSVPGHNIKLGRGGIREVEFFVQTQQLIMGGRDPSLRGRTTVGAMQALVARGLVAATVAEEMISAYRGLRALEHRLQMVADEQTHTLPEQEEALGSLALFSGFTGRAQFDKVVKATLARVNTHYAELFDEQEGEAGPPIVAGSLVFTGVEDDPDTLKTLRTLGFEAPERVSETIRGWHFGRIRATRSERARAMLTKLVPMLLLALSKTSNPDQAFLNFDTFLRQLPAGVQLFSMLTNNQDLLNLMADLLGTAPRLAPVLAKRPATLDFLLEQTVFEPFPDIQALQQELDQNFAQVEEVEDKLDLSRIFASERGFQIGVQLLRHLMDSGKTGRAYTHLAECLITRLAPVALGELEQKHGAFPGEFAVLAMGKLGGSEMTASSDLDLIFIYDVDDPSKRSEGPHPLEAMAYAGRAAQRIISFLTAPTAQGPLYEVDTRLRPSGRSGPLATQWQAFERYHREGEAWTWERMALTRARVVFAPARFRNRVTSGIHTLLSLGYEADAVLGDARDMRERLYTERRTADPWEIKLVRGGLVDVEFIAQTQQLIHGATNPQLLTQNTRAALMALYRAGILSPTDAEDLIHAATLYSNLTQVLRLCLTEPLDEARAGDNLKSLLAEAGQAADFADIKGLLLRTQERVYDLFARLIGPYG